MNTVSMLNSLYSTLSLFLTADTSSLYDLLLLLGCHTLPLRMNFLNVSTLYVFFVLNELKQNAKLQNQATQALTC